MRGLLPALLALAAVALAACQPAPLLKRPAASPSPGSVAAFLPLAERYVESARGLRFKHAVKVEYLDDARFDSRVLAEQRRTQDETVKEGRLLKAVGLIQPEVDVEAAEESLLRAGVLGYYDPRSKSLAVRGTTLTPTLKHVLVHELTHALQDQWFGIDTPDGMDGDAEAAFTAVVEGDARRIEQGYIATLPASDQAAVKKESGSLPTGVPPVLAEELDFPYSAGQSFLGALRASGGPGAIDAAFRDPPTATAQILAPQRYQAGFHPAAVPAPAAPAAPTSDGVLGDLRLALMLEGPVNDGRLTRQAAASALLAWQGDHFSTWTEGGRDCVRAAFAPAPGGGDAQLAAALNAFVAQRPTAAALESSSPVILKSCA
jgi:hypothetical protein